MVFSRRIAGTRGLVGLLLATTMVTAGCASSSSGTQGSKSTSSATVASKDCAAGAIAFSQPLPAPTELLISNVIKSDVQASGRKYLTADANLNPSQQASQIETMVQQGAKVVIVDPIDAAALRSLYSKLRTQGVKFVEINSSSSGADVTLVPRNSESAAAAAAYLKAKVGRGEVAAVLGPPFPALIPFSAGFKSGAKTSGLNLVATSVDTNISPASTRALALAFKDKFGSALKGIYVFTDTTALGAASARSGSFTPLVVTVQTDDSTIEAIKAGRLAATFDIHVPQDGHITAWAAEQLLCGRHIPSRIFVGKGVFSVDSSNVARYRSMADQTKLPFTVKLVKDSEGNWAVDVPMQSAFK